MLRMMPKVYDIDRFCWTCMFLSLTSWMLITEVCFFTYLTLYGATIRAMSTMCNIVN